MYEKYTGLPDTTKSPSQSGGSGSGGSSSDGEHRDSRSGEMEYYYSPNRGGSSGGSSSSHRRTSKRARARKRRIVVSMMTVAFLALLAAAIVILVRSCSPSEDVDPETDTFRSNVYINGTAVSGKTIDEVSTQLESNEAYALNNIAISLVGDDFSASISGADMDASSNLQEIMETALAGGANQVYYTTISIDPDALRSRIDEINAAMTTPATDATFTVDIDEDSGKPTFTYIGGTAGYGLDVEPTAQLVEQAIQNGQYQTTIQPTLTEIQPSVTVDDVKAHTTLIGKATTTYDFKGTAEDTEDQRATIPNRAYNVEKAASLINNQVVKTGKTWSFNTVVGDRTEANGWLLANGIFGGDTYTKQYGGGVCQVSTTLYNALLECYPYITIVERQKHSIPSTYVDKGLDATVDSNHIDFRFKNTSDYPLYIFAYISKNSKASSRKRDITVLVYGEALPEGVSYSPHTELIEEIEPGEDEITETNTLYIGEEEVTVEARSGYVVDVYIDRYLDGVLQESTYLYTDRYEGNPLKKKVGTMPTPTPVVEETPTPNPDDLP